MFLVQETWLEPGIDPQIANYRLTKDDRIEFPHTVTRGGTAIYCKNEIVHHRVPLPNLQGMDATAVQIKINNFPPINVVSAYVRRRVGHSFPVEDFKKIFNSGSNCIIAGDYNAALPSNYRPISLLSCLSKVYEFVLLQRLNQHCAAFNFIIPQQCGFRPKCSTVHQLLRVTELIHSGFAKHEATGILFLDIAKAYKMRKRSHD
ncbi:reverse transcriptase domain-containing protein [Trichonephila clavipes]|nr:reverse transcriptase domain-containing protein [Trichonephila clavipes]